MYIYIYISKSYPCYHIMSYIILCTAIPRRETRRLGLPVTSTFNDSETATLPSRSWPPCGLAFAWSKSCKVTSWRRFHTIPIIPVIPMAPQRIGHPLDSLKCTSKSSNGFKNWFNQFNLKFYGFHQISRHHDVCVCVQSWNEPPFGMITTALLGCLSVPTCTTSFFLCTSPFGTGTYLDSQAQDTIHVFIHLRYPACWPGPNLPNLTKTEAFNRPSAMALICFKVEFGGVAITSPHLNSHDPGESHGDVCKITRVWSVGAIHATLGYQSLQYLHVYVGPCILLPSCSLHPICIVRPSLPQQSASDSSGCTAICFDVDDIANLTLQAHETSLVTMVTMVLSPSVFQFRSIKCCIFNAHKKALLDLREWLWPSLFEGFHRSAEPTSGSFDPSSVSAWLGCHVRWLQRTRKPCVVFSPIITSALWIHQISLAYIVYI